MCLLKQPQPIIIYTGTSSILALEAGHIFKRKLPLVALFTFAPV